MVEGLLSNVDCCLLIVTRLAPTETSYLRPVITRNRGYRGGYCGRVVADGAMSECYNERMSVLARRHEDAILPLVADTS